MTEKPGPRGTPLPEHVGPVVSVDFAEDVRSRLAAEIDRVADAKGVTPREAIDLALSGPTGETDDDRTHALWINFYWSGNGSTHFTRETADETARLIAGDNPRIACIKVDAVIGEGLLDEENW
jgi:hypothetical protein